MLFAKPLISNQVIQELHLDREQLNNFTPPRTYHQHFCRTIINEINVHQLNLFGLVVEYAEEDYNNNQRRNSLVRFLEENAYFQGISYIEIWCLLAHELYLNQRKTLIPHYDIEQVRQTRIQRLINFQNHLHENIRHRQQNARNVVEEIDNENNAQEIIPFNNFHY